MSEFTCRNDHLILDTSKPCPECGEGVYRMDGMTRQQLRKMEDYENAQD